MIEQIRLKSFRRHEDICFEFDPKFNLIYGRNNAGKSTIFYAIEYCLFGNVQGFKKLSQLANYKKNVVGVEMIFKGKNDFRYKLQRMHKLTGKTRSAKGYYTLKRIEDEGEAYILSSDFGDREEDLSLKINEILGLSKRFFETGIHFYQGTVSQVLTGEKKLDIVFGIRAALALSDVFKERALDFEKEVKNIGTVEIALEKSRQEKNEYQKKMNVQEEMQKDIESIITSKEKELYYFQVFDAISRVFFKLIDDFSQKKRELENIIYREDLLRKDIGEIISKFGEIDTLKEKHTSIGKSLEQSRKTQESFEKKIEALQKQLIEIESQKVKLETVESQIKSKLGDRKNPGELKAELSKIQKEMEKITKEILELEKSIDSIQEALRISAQNKGDSEGILSRREKTKNEPKCEYCGAPIDPAKIQAEIKELKNKLVIVNKEIEEMESKEKDLKNKLIEIREKKDIFDRHISEFDANIKEIANLEKQISVKGKKTDVKDFIKKIEEINEELDVEKGNLNQEREKENKIRVEFNELDSSLSRINDLESKIIENEAKKQVLEASLLEFRADIIKNLFSLKDKLKNTLDDIKKKIVPKENTADFKTAYDLVPSQKSDMMEIKITSLIQKMDLLENDFKIELAVILKDELKEFLIAKTSEISTSLEHIKNQKKHLISEMEELKDHVKRLDKDIATMENALQALNKKKDLASQYRKYQNVFKDAQGIIRENASKLLEDEILKLHRFLSSDDEFERVHIDSEDYSLSVTPKGMDPDEYYPAWVYEGGGHKLILGLAYKFSLGKIIGNTPFLLVDEPTEFMDKNNRVNLLSKLSSTAENTQVLLITHQDVDKIPSNKKIELLK